MKNDTTLPWQKESERKSRTSGNGRSAFKGSLLVYPPPWLRFVRYGEEERTDDGDGSETALTLPAPWVAIPVHDIVV